MKRGNILSQILQWIPRHEFQRGVDKYEGDKGIRKLPCWSQFIALLFGQLTGHSSLRGIEAGLKSTGNGLYRIGISSCIRRSTLADANDKRDARIFEEAFYRILPKVQAVVPQGRLKVSGPIRALDSTLIELCLSLSPWAHYCMGKGAMKLHMAVDIAGNLPTVMVLSDGLKSDMSVAGKLRFSAGTLLLIDKGYMHYRWLWEQTEQGVGFITRMKINCKYRVRDCRKTNRTQGIIADQLIKLTGRNKGKNYEGRLRKISYRDQESGKKYIYLTNRFDLEAKTVCDLYKERWQVELFFKSMKQNLEVRKFVGTSVNAVKAQVWVALIAYLLVSMVKFMYRLSWGMPAIMAVLTTSLFANKELKSICTNAPKERCINSDSGQLLLIPI